MNFKKTTWFLIPEKKNESCKGKLSLIGVNTRAALCYRGQSGKKAVTYGFFSFKLIEVFKKSKFGTGELFS